ncbi:MAG: hypothetical protein ACPGRC_02525 [Salibacteraceae bacterium]
MRVTLFKLKKPKRFAYKPRHFDPVMEDLHSRVNVLKSELDADSNSDGSQISRDRIRKAWKTPEARKTANQTSTFRIAFIAILLFGFFYAYFFTDLIS